MTADALLCCQFVVESFIVELFTQASHCACHARRAAINEKDLQLIEAFRGKVTAQKGAGAGTASGAEPSAAHGGAGAEPSTAGPSGSTSKRRKRQIHNNFVRTHVAEPGEEALFNDDDGGDAVAAANWPAEDSAVAWLGQDGTVAKRPAAGQD